MMFDELDGFLPLCFLQKFKSEILSDNRSDFGYHFIPPTEMLTPSSVKSGAGSIPEKVIPLRVNPPRLTMNSSSSALVNAILVVDSPVIQSSMYTLS